MTPYVSAFADELLERKRKHALWFRIIRVIFQLALVCSIGWLLFGCSWLKDEATTIKDGVVDCTKAESAKVVHDLGPLAEVALVQAIGPDNKVDWKPIEALFKGAAVDVGGCVLAAAVQKILIPPTPQANAPKSEPIAVDKAALIGGWRAFATGHFAGAVFRTVDGDL